MSLSKWRRQFDRYRRALGKEVAEDLAFALFLEAKRPRKILSHGLSTRLDRMAAKRRYNATRARLIRVTERSGRKRRVIRDPLLLMYRARDEVLRDRLCPKFMSKWQPISKRLKDRKKGRVSLKDFSFTRNPKGVYRQLVSLIEASAKYVDIQLDFTDNVCDDVAPYVLLSHLLPQLPPVFSGGQISMEVASVIEAVGLDRALGVNRISEHEKSKYPILPFKMYHRAPPGAFGDKDHQLRPQYKEYVADRFYGTINQWLGTNDFEFTPEAAGNLINSITEALDNAERHGHPDIDEGMGDWSIAGFSRLKPDGEGGFRLECSVAIVSVGSTIAGSLSSASHDVTGLIDNYCNEHSAAQSDRDVLRTVMALQDGITRVSSASDARRGGVGLMTLVNLFADLGDTDNDSLQSTFTILSGKTCLRVTTPYRRGTTDGHSTLRQLWFNADNCATVPPDSQHAFAVPEELAGTVLSASFTIDPKYLSEKLAA